MAKSNLSDYIQTVGGEIRPQIINNAAVTGAYVTMAQYRCALVHCNAGAVVAAGALAWQVMQATDAAGTGAKVVAGYTAAHAAAAQNTTVLIEIFAENLDVVNGFDFIAIRATETATQNYYASAVIVRENCRYPQATLP